MQIIIEYDSTWRNSFLDGSNNQPLPKGGRKFIASMTNLRKAENYIERGITKDTVMGVLNRLIGENAKLYQIRQRENYYFKEIEAQLKESDIIDNLEISQETVFIRNITGSTSQNDFTGLIRADHPTFNSHYSNEFWGVLWLSLEEVIDFILNDKFLVLNHINPPKLGPIEVNDKALEIQSIKTVNSDTIDPRVYEILKTKYPEQEYISNEKLKPERLYAASLYLQLERLEQKFNEPIACNFWRGEKLVFGFSKRGFAGQRDFMKNFITGGQKIIYGGAYLTRNGKRLNKASGQLIINLNIPREQAIDLETKIHNAGVSAFNLGKKGLAYVSEIRI